MEVREGYKQTEVGVIPEDWEIRSLGSFSLISAGGTPSRSNPSYWNGSIPWVTTTEVDWCIICQTSQKITEEGLRNSPAKLLRTGTLLMALYGQGKTRGKVAVLGIEAATNQACSAISTHNSVSSQFVFHCLESKYEKIRNLSNIGNQENLNSALVRSILLPLPPTKAEQEAIAEALNDADGLIESLEQLITKKRQIKQGTMQELLTGKKRLPGFDGEWEEKLLPEVCQFRGGKAHEQYIDEGGRFICVNSKFISTEGKVRKFSTVNFCCAKTKDILMVMSDLPNGKALAKAYLADQNDLYAVNQRVCALTPYSNYNSEFLFYILNRNPYFLKFDNGVSQTHLLNPVFQKCPLRLPPNRKEQTAIATILSDMDTEITALLAKLSKAQQIKQGMMQELLTGRIRLV